MKRIQTSLFFLLKVHFSALLVLTILRIILYFSSQDLEETINYIELTQSFLIGIQFDNVILSYIIVLPVLVLSILSLCNYYNKNVSKFLLYYLSISYILIFSISSFNIPYFRYGFTHLDASVFHWIINFPSDTLKMIFQDKENIIALLFFIVLCYFFTRWIKYNTDRLSFHLTLITEKVQYIPTTGIIILLYALSFIGIRGTLAKYPIRISNAFFSTNAYYNKLALNPTFYLLKSFKTLNDKEVLDNIMDVSTAVAFVKNELNANLDEATSLGRSYKNDSILNKPNVVMVLMESMSSECLKMQSKGKPLTPYLNELISKSYYFDNFYSVGIHTNNGIVGSLCGFPAIFNRPSIPATPESFYGLPSILKERGYNNVCFLTSNPNYDNMNGFMMSNGFSQVFSQFDYPHDKIVNTFGVQDDFLFTYGVEQLSKEIQPFFAFFLTVSNHEPFVVPNAFKNVSNDERECLVSFADHSIAEFMEAAEKQDWFHNAIFIFLGDHGHLYGDQPHEMPLSFNHIPLIIYSPLFKDTPKVISKMASQVDLYPTLLDILGISFTNTSLGIDLFKESRPYSFFVSDSYMGCIDENYFYFYNTLSSSDALYLYKDTKQTNLINQYRAKADSMRNYATSMIKTTQYLRKENLIK